MVQATANKATLLGQDFGGILGTHQSGFQHCEARSHPHYQCAANEKIKRVERVLQLKYLVFHTVLLKCFRTGFTGTNTNNLFKGRDENFAVTDLARVGAGGDGLDRLIYQIVVDGDLEFYLG